MYNKEMKDIYTSSYTELFNMEMKPPVLFKLLYAWFALTLVYFTIGFALTLASHTNRYNTVASIEIYLSSTLSISIRLCW